MTLFNRTVPKPNYKTEFHGDEMQHFCYLVYLYRKQGYIVQDAQRRAYHEVLADSIPFDPDDG